MPDEKNLFSLDQDVSTDFVNKTYSITVNYTEMQGTPPTIPVIKEGTIAISHICDNDFEAIRYFMDNENYNYNDNR